MSGRDHSEQCPKCGVWFGGLDDTPCNCTQPEGTDDREALARIINGSWYALTFPPGKPEVAGLRVAGLRVADAILAAGFKRRGEAEDSRIDAMQNRILAQEHRAERFGQERDAAIARAEAAEARLSAAEKELAQITTSPAYADKMAHRRLAAAEKERDELREAGKIVDRAWQQTEAKLAAAQAEAIDENGLPYRVVAECQVARAEIAEAEAGRLREALARISEYIAPMHHLVFVTDVMRMVQRALSSPGQSQGRGSETEGA